jgi:hypothetical protein
MARLGSSEARLGFLITSLRIYFALPASEVVAAGAAAGCVRSAHHQASEVEYR